MNRSGFTLLEIVIAMMMSAMMGTILYNAFRQSTRTLLNIEEASALNTTGAVVLHQLDRDLSSVMMPLAQEKKDQQSPVQPQKGQPPAKAPAKKEIEKIFYATTKNNNVETLTFLTLTPLSSYDTPKPRLVRVMYKLKESSDAGYYTLTRQESIFFDVGLFEKSGEKKPRAIVVSDTIKKLSLEFIYTVTNKADKEEQKKAVVWDSDKKEQEGASQQPPLPASVKVQVQYTDNVHALDRTLSYEIPIVVYDYARRRDAFNAKRAQAILQTPQSAGQPNPMGGLMRAGVRGARSILDGMKK